MKRHLPSPRPRHLPLLFPLLCSVHLAASVTAARAAFPEAYVYVDVDFKVLVPTGTSPPASAVTANGSADTMLNRINQQMDNSWSGLRYRRFRDVQFITAAQVGDSDDADTANDLDDLFKRAGETDDHWHARRPTSTLFLLAPARPVEWNFRNDVCNFYILDGWPGGRGDFTTNIMTEGGFWMDPGTHELGHWFGLKHPFNSAPSGPPPPVGDLIPWSDDDMTDTLKMFAQGGQTLNSLAQLRYGAAADYASRSDAERAVLDGDFRKHYAKQFYNAAYADLTADQKAVMDGYRTLDQNDPLNGSFGGPSPPLLRDLIANGNFGSPGSPVYYANLSAAGKQRVDDLILNIMNYYFGKGDYSGLLSPQQLGRACDNISQPTGAGPDRSPTRGVEFGKYIFFGNPIGGLPVTSGNPPGSSKNPRATLASAAAAATGNDIIIASPGTQSLNGTTLTIKKAVTLRAFRDGDWTVSGH